MSVERVKDTIRKLLDLAANDAASEGEVNNAIRFARKLMMQHQLSEDDCREQTETPEAKVLRAQCARFDGQGASAKRSYWEGRLAEFCCKFVGGVGVYSQAGYKRTPAGIVQYDDEGKPLSVMHYQFYGIAEDAVFAKRTFDDLSTLVASMARLKWGGVFRGPGREYCEGFVEGLFKQIQQAESEQEASESRALVARRDALVVAKEARARDWLARQGVKLTPVRIGGGGWDPEARRDGENDGRRTQVDGKPLKLGQASQHRLGGPA